MLDTIQDHPVLTLGSLFVALFLLFAWVEGKEQAEWNIYMKQHHCVAKGSISSSIVNGFDSNGKMVTSVIPAKTIYACDNNETQIR